MKELLLQSEVAEILRVSDRTVARLRAEGKLPFLPGRPVRIRQTDLMKYIDGETLSCHSTLRDLNETLKASGKYAGAKKALTDTTRNASRQGRTIALKQRLFSQGS